MVGCNDKDLAPARSREALRFEPCVRRMAAFPKLRLVRLIELTHTSTIIFDRMEKGCHAR